MSVVVVATIRPGSGCRDQVMTALENAVARVHAEDEGCELYALYENDDRFVQPRGASSARPQPGLR